MTLTDDEFQQAALMAAAMMAGTDVTATTAVKLEALSLLIGGACLAVARNNLANGSAIIDDVAERAKEHAKNCSHPDEHEVVQ